MNVRSSLRRVAIIILFLFHRVRLVLRGLVKHICTLRLILNLPNCVYVIPPNKDMSLFHRKLHLFDPIEPRGRRLPIDYLFRSMAEDLGERAIAVILSGMGMDGTLGLKAIKEKGGLGLVQEPASAKFDSMPKSAINTGLVDVVAPAEELFFEAMDYLKHKSQISVLEQDLEDKDSNAFEKIVILLRSQTGHDFSHYKKTLSTAVLNDE